MGCVTHLRRGADVHKSFVRANQSKPSSVCTIVRKALHEGALAFLSNDESGCEKSVAYRPPVQSAEDRLRIYSLLWLRFRRVGWRV
jgi:hypothetical protein